MERGLPKPSSVLCAYFAGYTDAEGSINVTAANKGTTWVSSVSFGQTRSAVVERLHEIYGGTLRVVRPARLGWQPQTHWIIRRGSVVGCFLQDVLPYLREKRSQAELVLEHFASRMSATKAEELRATLSTEKKQSFDASLFHKDRAATCFKCSRRSKARGLCPRHYQDSRRAGLSALSKEFEYCRKPTEEEKAYVAGYFDGDGNCDVRGKYGTITFNQTRSEGIALMREIYGGTVNVRKLAPPRRQQLCYRMSKTAVVIQFLRDIEPHSIERQADIRRFLEQLTSSAVKNS